MEFRKLRILYIATSITGGGGVARILSQKTTAFVELGHEVRIISTNDKAQEPFYAFDSRVNFVFYADTIRTIRQAKQYYSFVQHQMNLVNPDVIIVIDNGIKGYLAPYFLSKKIPLYLEVHGSRNFLLSPIQSKLKRFIVDHLTKMLSRRFTGLILLTKSAVKDWTHSNIITIPNWIEVKTSDGLPDRMATKQIIAIGRIAPEKNYEEMLRIWSQISQKKPDWTLVICGTGELDYISLLKKQAGSSVKWKGEVENIDREIQESAFVLHTSKMEGLPMAFLEAMVLGVPVVAYDVAYGPADLIQNGQNGYLVPFGDQQQMIDCCLVLMSDMAKVKKFGMQAKQLVLQYDKPLGLQQWITFFESLG